MGTTELTRVLDDAGVEYELIPHPHSETAAAEAQALGVPPAEVAKTLVVRTPSGYLRAVLPASERLDLGKLAALHGESRKHVELASEDELGRDYPEFELGAVPPVGGAAEDAVVVDRLLVERESIVFEAGTHDESVRVAASDLVRIARATVADITQE